MIKGSMNTFLNAMTFPDKTMYPVSSRNDKDFDNLMSVYLDAVFHPALYENEKIFLQEGWHFEFPAGEENPVYNGVVLNEMRGADSSVESKLFNELSAALFPDTCYRFVSGGAPENIPDLTYEKFRETHSRFYHPSNSYFVLDGDMDIVHVLEILNEELSSYEKAADLPEIRLQAPVSVHTQALYPADSAEDHQGYLGLGCVIGQNSELRKIAAAHILAEYLAGNNDSPLVRRILSEGLGSDVSVQIADGMLQPFFMIIVRNTEPEERTKIEQTILKLFDELLNEGLNREYLEAILSQAEFTARERDFGGYPTGLVNAMNVMDSWLYGGEPTSELSPEQYYSELRKEIKDGTFDRYIKEIFTENIHRASVQMIPSDTLLSEEQEAEKDRIRERMEGLTEEDRTALYEKEKDLKNWQSVPNTPEEIEKLPCLALNDLCEEPMRIPTEVLNDGVRFHSAATNGIRYLHLFIPADGLSDEEMQAASYAAGLVGDLGLKDLSRTELDMAEKRVFGYFACNLTHFRKRGQAATYMEIGCSYMREREEEALVLLKRIVSDTDFTAADDVREYLDQMAEMIPQNLIMAGHRYAMYAAGSAVSEYGRRNELTEGATFFGWLKDTQERFREDPSGAMKMFEDICSRVFVKNGMIISVTDEEKPENFAKKITVLFPEGKKSEEKQKAPVDAARKNEGIVITAPISYGAKAGVMKGEPARDGSLLVLAKLASMDYLWQKIRVLGGAYGAGLNIGPDGSVVYYSYRDPNPAGSLRTFDGTGAFVKEQCAGNPDLTRIIIGTVSDTEPLLTARTMGDTADRWYLSGITEEFRKKRRQELLHTTPEKLCLLADELDAILPEMNASACGSEEVLKSCEGSIEKIRIV